MTKTVDFYWSHQSPYCYFSLDRILSLNGRADVDVVLRLVLPGVLRNSDAFLDRSEMEQRYFFLDAQRTAAFLGLSYKEARPYPVEMRPGTIYRAEENQPRIYRLYHLTAAAEEIGKGLAFLDKVTRLIWDGSTIDWHVGDALKIAIEHAGIDYEKLARRAKDGAEEFDETFASNHERLLKSGHWGVPVFVYEDEPFYGQDRFDQLVWRMEVGG